MVWKRKEGGKYRFGFNYMKNEGNTKFALVLYFPVFILPPRTYEDACSNIYYYGFRAVVIKIGFRFRNKIYWKGMERFILYRGIASVPIGMRTFVATRQQIEDAK